MQRGRAARAFPLRPRTAYPGSAAPCPLAQRDGRHGRRDGCRERAPPGSLSPEAQRAAWSPTRARTAQRGARSRGGRRNAGPEGGPGGSPMRGRGARPADPGARVGGDGAAQPSTGPQVRGRSGNGNRLPPRWEDSWSGRRFKRGRRAGWTVIGTRCYSRVRGRRGRADGRISCGCDGGGSWEALAGLQGRRIGWTSRALGTGCLSM